MPSQKRTVTITFKRPKQVLKGLQILGICRQTKTGCAIEVDPGLSSFKFFTVLCHELAHAALYLTGFHSTISHNTNEFIADRTSEAAENALRTGLEK